MKINEINEFERKKEVIWDKKIEMKDGIKLSTDIYLPQTNGKSFPTILIRTPYNKSRADEIEHGTRDVEYFVNNGYAVVIQDVRGRGDSEGEWVPFINEGKDGSETLDWISKQDWCDGKIAMMGGSYRGFVQWIAARENPDALTTMVSTAAAGKWFQELPFTNGTVSLTSIEWLNLTGGKTMQNPDQINWEEVLWHLPLKTMGEKMGRENTVWKEWLSHSTLDAYWKDLLLTEEDFNKLELPVLHITGWYDGDQPGAMHFYEGMKKNSPASDKQFLIAGPWNHGGTRIPRAKLGGMDFTKDSLMDLKKIHRLWFDTELKEDDGAWEELEEIFSDKKTKTFSMGENKWKERDSWPPRIEMTPWYFHSNGKANTLKGDGELKPESPEKEPFDSYSYDPEDPVVPEVDFNFYSDSHNPSSLDQRYIERRDDVLVFTSDVLENDTELAGTPEIKLFASTDKKDTDWVIIISDVYPDGKSVKISEGYLRSRYRNSLEEAELLEPNEIYEYNFEMSYTVNNTFESGHRIRVAVTSSYFPKVDRNPNTGAEIGEGEKMKVAKQKIYHDEDHPSKIILPIVKNENNC